MAEIQTHWRNTRLPCHLLPHPDFYKQRTVEVRSGHAHRRASRRNRKVHSHDRPNSDLCAFQLPILPLAFQ